MLESLNHYSITEIIQGHWIIINFWLFILELKLPWWLWKWIINKYYEHQFQQWKQYRARKSQTYLDSSKFLQFNWNLFGFYLKSFLLILGETKRIEYFHACCYVYLICFNRLLGASVKLARQSWSKSKLLSKIEKIILKKHTHIHK